MTTMSIILDGDNCWPDLKPVLDAGKLLHAPIKAVALLRGGMESGKHSVSVRIDFPDGQIAVVETSLELFLAAADAFRGRLKFEAEQAKSAH